MNPRSPMAQHLPTLTEVVDEASIADRTFEVPDLALSSPTSSAPPAIPLQPPTPSFGPVIDLSDDLPTAWRTPTPQEVDRLRGDDALFEATLSDHAIRRALAEARPAAVDAAVDLSLADEFAAPPAIVVAEPSPIDEVRLEARVLADVQRQVDALLEHRLREALVPLLAQSVDALVAQAAEVLASSLRDLVAGAVSREIERQRGR